MISWKSLIECIEKLQELPNGSGTEIEFTYQGVEYGICSYRDFCDIQKIPEYNFNGNKYVFTEEKEYSYKTLTELGRATDIGFSVETCWNDFTGICIKPDFDEYTFDEIYESYLAACKSHR